VQYMQLDPPCFAFELSRPRDHNALKQRGSIAIADAGNGSH